MAIADLLSSICSYYRDDTRLSVLTTILAVPVVYTVVNEVVRKNARLPGMKGPSGLPLIGNLWDIRVNAAEKYREWVKTFGDVYQIQLGNIPVVVINSAAAAKTIIGHNAQALSSRPEFYTFHKVGPYYQVPRSLANTTTIGGIEHCRYYYWNLSVQRLAEASQEGRCFCVESAVGADLRAPPGYRNQGLYQGAVRIRRRRKETRGSDAHDPAVVTLVGSDS